MFEHILSWYSVSSGKITKKKFGIVISRALQLVTRLNWNDVNSVGRYAYIKKVMIRTKVMIRAQTFRKFFIPHEIQCFRLQVVFFLSLSFCLHLIANAICNNGNVEHGYHGAYGWCCIAQICNGTMYIRFTLTLICWICMFGILLGFYNIIMHTPFLLDLRCHYTNVGSVPKQMLNELMIACMLMFM